MACQDCGGSGSTGGTMNGNGASVGAQAGVPTRRAVDGFDGPTLDGPVTTTSADQESAGRCADLGAIVNAAAAQDWSTLRAELARVPWWAWALLAVLLLRGRR